MVKYLLHHLLEESAAVHPDKVAIRTGEMCITYKTLNEKSNQVANQLIDIGFKPGDTAGILFNKSIASIISFFGVLKAGGAYIPMDFHYSPLPRIHRILSLSKTNFLVSDSENLEQFNTEDNTSTLTNKLKILNLDTIQDANNTTDREKPLSADIGTIYFFDHTAPKNLTYYHRTTDNDLAYVLYTSGSTGTPKGVMISHLNALTFINWSLSCFQPTEKDVFSNHAPFHFDLSVFDIFVPMACGASLSIAPSPICSNPRALIAWMGKNEISYWYSVPSVWISIMNYARIDSEKLNNLSHILFAGEIFPPKYLKQLMVTLPQASYYNLYGPTETNVCTYHHVKSPDEFSDRPVPIGKACENTEVLALNENNKDVSIDEVGELMVKGSTVTAGYYRDDKKTKNAFMTSPLPRHNGSLLYKTGDIVRKREDNTFEYVGRKDLMVKVSGYRVEIPEVEHVLSKHAAVEEAVIVPLFDEERGTTILIAIVKLRQGASLSIMEVKNHLGDTLPRYMIPEDFELVDEIPKNSNGKIDRPLIMKQYQKHLE